jgi:serine/threonine-protein kinase
MARTFPDGHILAGRYRISGLVGVGSTAEVYAAEDLSLQRRVAVKVLLADLAAHEEVRRAFRDHIVRASTLSHPHLARVYDGGQESGSIFMISEYLAGGSLEDVLASGRRLDVDDGARLGRDVASALAYAHEHGFVLGSLSPSKLLFDDQGAVRVSDVALAGLSAGHRERMSLDDARYLSPEQAIGEPATAKSDVYALALILFEAVTGAAAFEGATAEAVLRARLHAPLPVRLELGTLDMILAQATVPDPLLRLDAEQFAARLGGVVGDTTPLVVRPGAEELPLLAHFEPTEPRRSIGFRPPSADQIVGGPVGSTGGFSRVPRGQVPSSGAGRVGGPIGPAGRTPRFGGSYDLPRAPRRRTGFLVAAIVLIVLAAAAGAAWKLGVFKKSYAVPDLVGMTLRQAATAASPDGFVVSEVGRAHNVHVASGRVLSQSPKAGASAKSGTDVKVTLSEGPAAETLPTDLVGMSCADARLALSKLHVHATCPASAAIYSSTTTGDVARVLYGRVANPPAVPENSIVELQLSKGPSPSTTTTTTSTTTTTTPGATTTTTTSPPGQGPRPVPNVVGDDYAQAYAAFKKAVLYFTTEGPGAGTTTWTQVVSENPAPGTSVPYKSTVVLTVK